MLCLSRKRIVVIKDWPHGPGRSVTMFIVVECEDHSAIQAPKKNGGRLNKISKSLNGKIAHMCGHLSLKNMLHWEFVKSGKMAFWETSWRKYRYKNICASFCPLSVLHSSYQTITRAMTRRYFLFSIALTCHGNYISQMLIQNLGKVGNQIMTPVWSDLKIFDLLRKKNSYKSSPNILVIFWAILNNTT